MAAEDKVIGAVLTQETEGKEYAITYVGRRLVDAETSSQIDWKKSARITKLNMKHSYLAWNSWN